MPKSPQRREIYQLVMSAALVVPACAATFYAAFMLRFAGEIEPPETEIYLTTLVWVLVIKWLAFVWFRLHQNRARFVGFYDLLIISRAVPCGSLGVTLVDTMCLPHVTIPRSIILIDWGA